jgi:hypothetical protein
MKIIRRQIWDLWKKNSLHYEERQKERNCDPSLSAKEQVRSNYSQCCRDTAIRSFPLHMPAVQIIGLMLTCNCIPIQTGIRDMGTREMQLLHNTAKCFLHLSVPSNSTCSVTEMCTLCRTCTVSSWRNWRISFLNLKIWTKANGAYNRTVVFLYLF